MKPAKTSRSHFIFAVLQSGLTSFAASGIASYGREDLVTHWAKSWALAWALMIPLVLLAAPGIRRLALWLSGEGGLH